MLLFVFAFAFAFVFASVLLLCFLTLTNKRFSPLHLSNCSFIAVVFFVTKWFVLLLFLSLTTQKFDNLIDYSYFFVNVSQLLSVTLYFLYLLFWCLIDYFSPLLLQFLFLLLLLLANASSVFVFFVTKWFVWLWLLIVLKLWICCHLCLLLWLLSTYLCFCGYKIK